MEVTDPLPVVTNVLDDISVHDLRVKDVEEHLASRRVHPLHHAKQPCGVITLVSVFQRLCLVGADELRAERDALILGARLEPVQQRHEGIRIFLL
jgi:hypothetical protein